MTKNLLVLLVPLLVLTACGGDDNTSAGAVPSPSPQPPQVPAGEAVIRCAPAAGSK